MFKYRVIIVNPTEKLQFDVIEVSIISDSRAAKCIETLSH